MSLLEYESALDRVITAQTEAELAAIVRECVPPVRLTSPERRYDEQVEVRTTGMFNDIKKAGRWQVARDLLVVTKGSKIMLDFTDAEFDDWEIDLQTVAEDIGDITLVVAPGTSIKPMRTSGRVRSKLEPDIPGYPLIRLTAEVGLGTVRLRHPTPRELKRRNAS